MLSHSFLFIQLFGHSFQVINYNSFLSIYAFHFLHSFNSFISTHSCQFVRFNSFMSIHFFYDSFILLELTSFQLTKNSYKQTGSYSHVHFFETSAAARAGLYLVSYIHTYIYIYVCTIKPVKIWF